MTKNYKKIESQTQTKGLRNIANVYIPYSKISSQIQNNLKVTK